MKLTKITSNVPHLDVLFWITKLLLYELDIIFRTVLLRIETLDIGSQLSYETFQSFGVFVFYAGRNEPRRPWRWNRSNLGWVNNMSP